VKLRVLALALDGTIAVEGRLDGDVANALREARRAGIMTVLVSERMLPDIQPLLPSRDLFDAIVAESGAVVQMANGASPTVLARGPDAAPAERGRSGLPHWIVVDEAHYFFGAGGASSADAVVQTGNAVLVTYRPSSSHRTCSTPSARSS
jgi:hypothetical protein